jgi:tripartite-type tricarboxylate transporter receptor subunit TctC
MSMELFMPMTGTDMALIPYKREAPTAADALAGRMHFTFATPASAFMSKPIHRNCARVLPSG